MLTGMLPVCGWGQVGAGSGAAGDSAAFSAADSAAFSAKATCLNTPKTTHAILCGTARPRGRGRGL